MPLRIPSAMRAKARVAIPILAGAVLALVWTVPWTMLMSVFWAATLIEITWQALKHPYLKMRRLWIVTPLLFIVWLGFWTMSWLRYVEHGVGYIVLIASAVMACDIAAQLVGSNVREKIPFFPTISPNKSLQGTIGGVVGGMVTGGLVMLVWWFVDHDMPLLLPSLCTVLAPPLGVAGDLVESKAKRALGIKDFSRALGAHGGFADRFDALTFAFFILGFSVLSYA